MESFIPTKTSNNNLSNLHLHENSEEDEETRTGLKIWCQGGVDRRLVAPQCDQARDNGEEEEEEEETEKREVGKDKMEGGKREKWEKRYM